MNLTSKREEDRPEGARSRLAFNVASVPPISSRRANLTGAIRDRFSRARARARARRHRALCTRFILELVAELSLSGRHLGAVSNRREVTDDGARGRGAANDSAVRKKGEKSADGRKGLWLPGGRRRKISLPPAGACRPSSAELSRRAISWDFPTHEEGRRRKEINSENCFA